ncbi:MAG: hypothetical protein K2Z25_21260 [Beijerinckiaceae bacterium]|nr:hypothetical protein [Bradyrhizobium sp. CCH5-A9]MBX9911220.1 hypothetical protein [Beijerinckiaceae bacterium]
MTLTIGTWGFPAAVTLMAFGWLAVSSALQPPPAGYASIGDGIVGMFYAAAALIVSLSAWLLWAVLT